jgi:transcriptional regulator with XRE-family HTH domain
MNDDRAEIPAAKRAREIRIAVAVKVRETRQQRGYSQETLAEACLVSRSLISRIEQGRHEPRLSTLLVIADALGVAPGEFLNAVAAAVGRSADPGPLNAVRARADCDPHGR